LTQDSYWPTLIWKFQAKEVYLVGDFTDFPWEERIPMRYHEICGLWYSTYLADNECEPGQYKFKFVVDGEWLCDGNHEI
jgi:hypothetical protein